MSSKSVSDTERPPLQVVHRDRFDRAGDIVGFLRALRQRAWQRGLALHHVTQSGPDGAIARYYKPVEWRRASQNLFITTAIQICGLKTDVLPLPYGRLKNLLLAVIPDSFARLLTSRLRMGSLLIAQMQSRKAD